VDPADVGPRPPARERQAKEFPVQRKGWTLIAVSVATFMLLLDVVQFARAALERRVASERALEAYEALFDRRDQAAFPVLVQEQGASESRKETAI
jgi:hypothetical protein